MNIRRTLLFWMWFGLCVSGAIAQELTPRAYWPAPKGVKGMALGYVYQTGDILTDPSIPVYGVDSRINTTILGYLQMINFSGRTASIVVELPYSWGTTSGILEGSPARRDFAGFGDLAVKLTVNLIGAPSMNVREFQQFRANPRPIVGASLRVVAPTGEYDENLFINTGANRWSAKPEISFIVPLSPKWIAEFGAGAWFFSPDGDFVAGKREQDPILAAEIHLVRRFRAGFWASFDINYYEGGQQKINGVPSATFQRNGKVGGTIVIPFRNRHAVKFAYNVGYTADAGADFKQALVTYNVAF